jgi:tRNA A-37 threonylcarbamoyl transferase component Bud32
MVVREGEPSKDRAPPHQQGASWLGRLLAQRYRLIGRLGEGKMADVYLARHVLIDRLSAIKVLRPELGGDDALRKRFLQEAKAVNRINHPNIVEISDYGETDGTAYLVMEYVPGEALFRRLAQGPLGFGRSLQIGLQIASALSRSHEMGVVHCDLTPSNVLLVPRRDGGDLVKLTDFGVARMLHASAITEVGLAAMGVTALTPGYTAPEVVALGAVDARSDLYSLGVLLFEATSGRLPRTPLSSGPVEIRNPQSIRPPLRLTQVSPDVPPLFDEIVATLLAVDPDDRPRDAFEAFEMLRRVAEETDAPVSRGSLATVTRPSDPRPRRAGPHLLTVSFERIGPMCERAWERLAPAIRGQASKPEAAVLADASGRLVRMVEGLARIVATDAQNLAEVEERGRQFRLALGAELDRYAKQKSQSLGWAGTIAERHDFVRAERHSGAHPITEAEAMLWEQAALEREEERAYAEAHSISEKLTEIQAELEQKNSNLEHEIEVLTAQLDGHIAALRSLAVEAWMSIDQLASILGVELTDDVEEGSAT